MPKLLPVMLSLALSSSCISSLRGQNTGQGEAIAPHELIYSSGEQFWSKLPTSHYYGPLSCTSDGAVTYYSYLTEQSAAASSQRFDDLEKVPMQLSVIEPNGRVQNYDFSVIDDLERVVHARSYDVGENDVDFLVHAVPKRDPGADPTAGPADYIARFNREGQYLGVTELNLPGVVPMQLATFPNGDVLIFGVDNKENLPRLVRYSLFGQKEFVYRPKRPFAKKNEALSLPTRDGRRLSPEDEKLTNLREAVSFSQMVHYKNSILLMQMDAGAPLFQVYESGSIRTIDLPSVTGYLADSLIPSDALLYVRYVPVRGRGTGMGKDALVLELNPSSGGVIRQILPGDFPIWRIACVHDGSIRAIAAKSGYLHFETAELR